MFISQKTYALFLHVSSILDEYEHTSRNGMNQRSGSLDKELARYSSVPFSGDGPSEMTPSARKCTSKPKSQAVEKVNIIIQRTRSCMLSTTRRAHETWRISLNMNLGVCVPE
ncbi:predicted protein [Histoplasma capsulatum var. duboisii H88]|uniref:Predicted protein n=2 Tax=Ajellomyces capsulatus TaxID=5037 RepID=F0UI29_AJEC8|nr:predicted protein [Histoplasma capsulatum H143]EGC46334.1 predicted protein [Histoplasma capsulatum var. duboisii H88]